MKTVPYFVLLFWLAVCTSAWCQTAAAGSAPVADTSYWKHSYTMGLNLTQASFSANWKSGGVNAISFAALFNGKSVYEKYKWSYTSDVQLNYGLSDQGAGLRKNVDRIFYDTKVGYGLSAHWSSYYNLNLTTQFDVGYQYATANGQETRSAISRFFAPGYVTNSLGLEWKPVKYFKLSFGLVAHRFIFVVDTTLYRVVPGNYGVVIGQTYKSEIASQIVAELDKDIAKNVNLKTRLLIFKAYDRSFEESFIRWDLALTGKINNWLNASLTAAALYDKFQDKNIQLSQVIAIGLLYKIK
jgi:hypothetical protein